tara:strand:- start:6922 stop:7443 length:522 start_codon:yes stop_codon:yes gene_type:complete
MSTLAVNTLQAQTGSTVSVASGQNLHAPGHIVQVVGNMLEVGSGNVTFSSTSFTPSGFLSPLITPKFANSKIKVECDVGMIYGVNAGNGSMSKLYRSVQGGSYVATNNTIYGHFHESSGSDNISPHMHSFLDSPTYTLGNTIRYQLYCRSQGNGDIYVYQNSMVNFTISEVAQ